MSAHLRQKFQQRKLGLLSGGALLPAAAGASGGATGQAGPPSGQAAPAAGLTGAAAAGPTAPAAGGAAAVSAAAAVGRKAAAAAECGAGGGGSFVEDAAAAPGQYLKQQQIAARGGVCGGGSAPGTTSGRAALSSLREPCWGPAAGERGSYFPGAAAAGAAAQQQQQLGPTLDGVGGEGGGAYPPPPERLGGFYAQQQQEHGHLPCGVSATAAAAVKTGEDAYSSSSATAGPAVSFPRGGGGPLQHHRQRGGAARGGHHAAGGAAAHAGPPRLAAADRYGTDAGHPLRHPTFPPVEQLQQQAAEASWQQQPPQQQQQLSQHHPQQQQHVQGFAGAYDYAQYKEESSYYDAEAAAAAAEDRARVEASAWQGSYLALLPPPDLPLQHVSVQVVPSATAAAPASAAATTVEDVFPYVLRALLQHPSVAPQLLQQKRQRGGGGAAAAGDWQRHHLAEAAVAMDLAEELECRVELHALRQQAKQLIARGSAAAAPLAVQKLLRADNLLAILHYAAAGSQHASSDGDSSSSGDSQSSSSRQATLGALEALPYALLSLSSRAAAAVTVVSRLYPLRICAVLYALWHEQQQRKRGKRQQQVTAAAAEALQSSAAAADLAASSVTRPGQRPEAAAGGGGGLDAAAAGGGGAAGGGAAAAAAAPPSARGGGGGPPPTTAAGGSSFPPPAAAAAPSSVYPPPPPPPEPPFAQQQPFSFRPPQMHAAAGGGNPVAAAGVRPPPPPPPAPPPPGAEAVGGGRCGLQDACIKKSAAETRKWEEGLEELLSAPTALVHFRRIILAHTDVSLGDCSYLDTCRHIETCKYVHYEVDDPSTSEVLKKRREGSVDPYAIGAISAGTYEEFPAQWIRCDIRTFDFSIFRRLIRVVMADPPWDIHMDLPYGTMTDQEMRSLRVDLIQEEGLLFLWVTGRAMEVARECLELWGYRRVEEILWVKTNQLQRIIRTGRTGHWLNHSKEHCLVGIKGENFPLNRNIDCDVIVSEVRETSRKPDEIYRIIERMCPDTLKVELFGRMHNVRNNWITLGNQLKGVKLEHPLLIERYNAFAPTVGLPLATPAEAAPATAGNAPAQSAAVTVEGGENNVESSCSRNNSTAMQSGGVAGGEIGDQEVEENAGVAAQCLPPED